MIRKLDASPSPWRERQNFSRIQSVVEIPDLIETQQSSYRDFLQEDVVPDKRREMGLQQAFKSIFPIKGRDTSSLDFVGYHLGRPKYKVMECIERGMTYAAPLRIKVRLVIKAAPAKDAEPEVVDIREEDIYLGEIPLMTDRGTFVINGAERVVVSQLHRSPGAVFNVETHHTGQKLITASIIPNRGAWLEFENDLNDVLYVIIDRKRKMPVTILLRAFGYGTDEEIFSLFIERQKVSLQDEKKALIGRLLATEIRDPSSEATVFEAGTEIDEVVLNRLSELNIHDIVIVRNHPEDFRMIWNTILKDPTKSRDDALREIYATLRPGEPPAPKNAEALIQNLFFRARRYDLSKVGRYRMNTKLGIHIDQEKVTLCAEDLVAVVSYILGLNRGEGVSDDIDHLGNRRVRTIGELLENQIRVGLARMERTIREKMGILDLENIMPRNLINAKPITTAVADFFGRSQLSQFLDQVNPLSELTHKRRLSALGPGGLNRERAGFEVRDVHHTHYGRICPIETPEGPNIGLISSLSTYARINEFGFIETPYRRVKGGRVTNEIVYLSADEEDRCIIAQANAPIDDKGKFKGDLVLSRERGNFPRVPPDKVDFMDVSPLQLVSISAALIPFLENDDANRALMGSNMQRQAVPLLKTEAPLIGTGVEYKAAKDSGVVVVAKRDGLVEYVSAERIVIRPDNPLSDNDVDVYPLKKFVRSNQNTCINQKPIVRKGMHIHAGDVIADGPATDNGELALGRNVLAAFMSWEGDNFEDAIVVSERLIRDDVFTSVHIEEFKVEARDTKLGEEEITRDIPNVGEEALKNLDEKGIIRIGATVRAGDILVGKVSPKGKVQTTNVEKLLRAIFGKRAEDVRDISLKAPPGTEGIVVDVKEFQRKLRTGKGRGDDATSLKRLAAQRDRLAHELEAEWDQRIHNFVLGKTAANDLVDTQTGEIIVPAGKKITSADLKKVQGTSLRELRIEDDTFLDELHLEFSKQIEDVHLEYEKEVERIKMGDNLPPGVIKLVKVYVAKKKRLSIGDKMAGRHGNKGVVSKIVPLEDMPFLEDGTPVDIVLNPLGVPSRMNVGQVFEIHLGWAAQKLGRYVATPVFDGATEEDVVEHLRLAGLPEDGKTVLYDGRAGEPFSDRITVGYIYMMKLNHLVDDKMHARSIGPYSLVTQQPLGGKAQFGGQRLGEMEVWALEAYGAAHTLQELLTVKSDDIIGRNRIYEAIVKGENARAPGLPESFYVLVKELQSLGLGIEIDEMEEEEEEEEATKSASTAAEQPEVQEVAR
ncbi:MAG TPA: DNA-directed RNA polymerase subunit beta [bacterium]|nr:DNA-directed RNA polymerase subunit beta [bacterium]HQL63821.1 DNA-directed RNA polymerase subunit beta [bacterium]